MEHKLLIDQYRGWKKWKWDFIAWHFHGTSQTQMYAHIYACTPFCCAPFCTASSGDDMQNINKSPGATTVFLKLALCPLAVNLTSKAIWYKKYKVLGKNMQEISQHKGDVPSLGWTDLQLMQINVEGHFDCPNKTCNPHAPKRNSSSSSTCFLVAGNPLKETSLLDVAQSTHYESKLTERETNCLYKIL